MRIVLISLIIIFQSLNSQSLDSLSYKEKLRSGFYAPYIKLDSLDSIEWPSKYFVSLTINDLRDISYKNDYFYIRFQSFEYTTQDTLYISNIGEEIIIDPRSEYTFEYPEGDRNYAEYSDIIRDTLDGDSIYKYNTYFEGELPHKWDLYDFPFDKQELKIQFRSGWDTSVTRIYNSENFKTEIVEEDLEFLKDGYSIKGISIDKEFVEGPLDNYPDSYRPGVYEKLVYKINLERDSGYLFFKLFFGGFLSYIISLLVFFIDKKLFETRITLSLGGIFGGVGNKYFVENSLPEILVLTKADILNNILIVFIILNIFIVIAQSTKNINIGLLENNKSSIYISMISLLLISSITILI